MGVCWMDKGIFCLCFMAVLLSLDDKEASDEVDVVDILE